MDSKLTEWIARWNIYIDYKEDDGEVFAFYKKFPFKIYGSGKNREAAKSDLEGYIRTLGEEEQRLGHSLPQPRRSSSLLSFDS